MMQLAEPPAEDLISPDNYQTKIYCFRPCLVVLSEFKANFQTYAISKYIDLGRPILATTKHHLGPLRKVDTTGKHDIRLFFQIERTIGQLDI